MEQYLYLWAIVPPPQVVMQIEAVRQEFSTTYGAVKGLRPPVHLTLCPPFSPPELLRRGDLHGIESWLALEPVFPLELRDFGFFTGRSPVVFIGVAQDDNLLRLQSGLAERHMALFGLQPENRPYHPHFTIGYRDVPVEQFEAIRAGYSGRTFEAQFPVEEVVLFKHNGIKWELDLQLPLLGGGG